MVCMPEKVHERCINRPVAFPSFLFFHNFNEEDPGYKAVFIPSIGNDVEHFGVKM